jgi:hypothetical protein
MCRHSTDGVTPRWHLLPDHRIDTAAFFAMDAAARRPGTSAEIMVALAAHAGPEGVPGLWAPDPTPSSKRRIGGFLTRPGGLI